MVSVLVFEVHSLLFHFPFSLESLSYLCYDEDCSITSGLEGANTCRFSHTKQQTSLPSRPPELNFLGLPIRPGEKECPFYMRNGSCKFGGHCKFNHPAPTTAIDSPMFRVMHSQNQAPSVYPPERSVLPRSTYNSANNQNDRVGTCAHTTADTVSANLVQLVGSITLYHLHSRLAAPRP
ncbi:BnaCnng15770D [Brassica napus]|nr:BnaCnng15770D [Brassica napus]